MSSRSGALPARPGVVRGPYPERADQRPGILTRSLDAAAALVRSFPRPVSPARQRAFVRRIDRAADGLAHASERRFDEAVASLREGLRRSGPCPPLVERGFALIREAARRTLHTPHHDVQLVAGWIMAHDGLAEMETGEGKTLAATLPASIAALAGVPVHVITANDYLVERDGKALAPLYARLGLTTGTVRERDPDRDLRRAAYACDVTYVSNKQVAFDYLRDRLQRVPPGEAWPHALASRSGGEAPVLRGLCLAIVDEADSVLIDDACTPLILSRPTAPPDGATVRTSLALAHSLAAGRDFRLDRRRARVELTPSGRARLDALTDDGAAGLGGRRWRDEWVRRALSAVHLHERGRDYVVREGCVQIIDRSSGRRAPDRSFEGGIQPLVEAKEGVALTGGRETVTRISYQRFFRRYLRLAGMTGTAREVAGELSRVYGLPTRRVPTRVPSRRIDLGRRILADAELAREAVVDRIRAHHGAGRPVLVGTATVEAAEQLAERLRGAGLPHAVLSARQDLEEHRVVARAGMPGCITVATRMAGRGTDIRLGPGVAAAGGLAVISTELGEARRIDRQLFGRCGRQGSPGSFEQVVSLQDTLLIAHLPCWLRRILTWAKHPQALHLLLTHLSQRAEERRSALGRRQLLRSEQALDDVLAFSGRGI